MTVVEAVPVTGKRPREVALRHGRGRAALWLAHGLATRALGLAVNRVLWLEAERLNGAIELPRGCTCRALTAEDVARLAADPSNCLKPSMAERIPRLGHLCLATFRGDRKIAHIWYATGRLDPPDHWLPMTLPPGTALGYDAVTHPEERGRRINGAMKRMAFQALAPRGVGSLAALVRVANWPSLQSLRRMGYEELGLLVTLGTKRGHVLRVSPRVVARGIRFQNTGP